MSAIQQAMMAVPAASAGVTYATWDSSKKTSEVVLTGGNLGVTLAGAGTGTNSTITVVANMTKSTGKWYWEIYVVQGSVDTLTDIGFANSSFDWLNNSPGCDVAGNSASYREETGKIQASNADVKAAAIYTQGDTIGFALNAGGNYIDIYKNNNLEYSGSIPAGSWSPAVGTLYGYYGATSKLRANFGATALTYSPPAGYNAGLYI